MATKKSQNSLREQILSSGNVRASQNVQPSAFKYHDPVASQAAAIAARRADIKVSPSISTKGK